MYALRSAKRVSDIGGQNLCSGLTQSCRHEHFEPVEFQDTTLVTYYEKSNLMLQLACKLDPADALMELMTFDGFCLKRPYHQYSMRRDAVLWVHVELHHQRRPSRCLLGWENGEEIFLLQQDQNSYCASTTDIYNSLRPYRFVWCGSVYRVGILQ